MTLATLAIESTITVFGCCARYSSIHLRRLSPSGCTSLITPTPRSEGVQRQQWARTGRERGSRTCYLIIGTTASLQTQPIELQHSTTTHQPYTYPHPWIQPWIKTGSFFIHASARKLFHSSVISGPTAVLQYTYMAYAVAYCYHHYYYFVLLLSRISRFSQTRCHNGTVDDFRGSERA